MPANAPQSLTRPGIEPRLAHPENENLNQRNLTPNKAILKHAPAHRKEPANPPYPNINTPRNTIESKDDQSTPSSQPTTNHIGQVTQPKPTMGQPHHQFNEPEPENLTR
jgi:hypothetical protein